jgi:transcriptional regulator with XRE-family HTH domain
VKTTLAQQFGSCVRELRLESGASQVEFGERCGFYQTYLSRIERGQANPTLNAIEVIANALGMTVFELFDRVKEHQVKSASATARRGAQKS